MIGPTPSPQVYVNPGDAVGTLRILNKKAANLRTPLTQIKNLMVADHARNFDTGGSLFGGWPGASSETQTSSLMRKTGQLRKELGSKTGPGKKVESRKGIARAGAGVFYARFHQAGAPAGKRKGDLPKREVVGITDATERKSIEIIAQYLKPR